MTTRDFYEAQMFEGAEELFTERSHAEESRPSALREGRAGVTSVTAKLLRSAVAAGALTVFTFHGAEVSASSPHLGSARSWAAEAAVAVPRLTPEQARGARLFRNLCAPLPPDPEAEKGEDPDYDL